MTEAAAMTVTFLVAAALIIVAVYVILMGGRPLKGAKPNRRHIEPKRRLIRSARVVSPMRGRGRLSRRGAAK